MIGLASLTADAMAETSYDGDLDGVYAPIFGDEPEADPARTPLPDVARALGHMAREYPETALTYVILHDPGTAGQHVQLAGLHERRLIFCEYYAFGADGSFHGTAGLADGTLGQQAAASIYSMHFGDFGGLPVKLAYILFGLALTAVCATGVYIWLGKRSSRGLHEPRLRAAWHGVVWGSPIALALTLAARFAFVNAAPFTAIFWMALVLSIAAAIASASRRPIDASLATAT